MIRKIYFLVVLLTMYGCMGVKNVNSVLIRNDSKVIYKNYTATCNVPFDEITNLSSIKSNDYTIKTFEKCSLEIHGKIYNYVVSQFKKCKEDFYKNLMGNDYVENINDSNSIKPLIIYCGKTKFQKGIDSYVFLMKEKNMLFENLYNQTLLLFNTQNEKLRSIIVLAEQDSGVDTSTNIKTYYLNDCFSQIDFSHNDVQTMNFIPKSIQKMYHLNKKIKPLYFTNFKIDEMGFIRLIEPM